MPAEDLAALEARARAWLAGDPDPYDAQALEGLLARALGGDPAATVELAACLGPDLAFGTAGLRGPMRPGPAGMNTAVVVRAAAALAGYLTAALPGADPTPLVVVGFDARHRSAAFAADTVAVLTAAGCRAAVLPRALPTPVLAAAVRRLGADAGVMVTASHNPPADNGYKVYLGGRVAPGPGAGVQIVPPVDAEVAGRIRTGPAARDVPRATGGWQVLGEDAVDQYVAAAAALAAPGEPGGAPQPSAPPPRQVRVVATALHGVGAAVLERALAAAGFAAPVFVAEQRDPDPDFPTVAFPNPEEPGALDLALALAEREGADLVVALDPDADRCALAAPGRDGRWQALSGDRTGALLAEHVLARRSPGAGGADPGEPPVVATSIVSSSMLERIAAAHGVGHRRTLTGFKWIARVPGLVYGYEEALGYCVDPRTVRDKDGVATAVLACELVASLLARGRSVADALDDLDRAHGVHATAQVTVPVSDPGAAAALLGAVVQAPPPALAGAPVGEVVDLSRGDGGLPPTPGVTLRARDGALRLVLRPSGTEPKVKAYAQVVVDVPADSGDAGLADARARAAADLAALLDGARGLLS